MKLLHVRPVPNPKIVRGLLPQERKRPLRQVSLSALLPCYHGDEAERRRIQGGLLTSLAGAPGSRVLDLAMGDGVDAVPLATAGYEVTGNEIDLVYLQQAKRRIRNAATSVRLARCDWLRMRPDSSGLGSDYSLVYALGNSFPTYAGSLWKARLALHRFHELVRPEGHLLLDSRNYDHILDDRHTILADPVAGYRFKGRSTYLNITEVTAIPYHISGRKIWFMWVAPRRGFYSCEQLLAVRRREILRLLRSTGFVVEDVVFDYGESSRRDYDFVQFVARRARSRRRID